MEASDLILTHEEKKKCSELGWSCLTSSTDFYIKSDEKIILATNQIERLDPPALIRPGRIDRKIEFPLPDIKTMRKIFTIHTSKISLQEDVNIEELVQARDDL